MTEEILTPELIQTVLGTLFTLVCGLFVKEKVDKNNVIKYTDPNSDYNTPFKGASKELVDLVSQDDYGAVATTPAGKISSEGIVIGEAGINLLQRDPRGCDYETIPFTTCKLGVNPIFAVKCTPIKTGTVVLGYSHDNKDIKVIGQKDVATTNGAPKYETVYVKYTQYTSELTEGEHTVTILQGYVDGKTPLGADNIVWFKKNDFLIYFEE